MILTKTKQLFYLCNKFKFGTIVFLCLVIIQVVGVMTVVFATDLSTTLPFDMLDYPLSYQVVDKKISVSLSEQLPVADILGRIDAQTLSSDQVQESNNMTFCSLIAYNNLKKITGAKDIKKGDAIRLWNESKSDSFTGSLQKYIQDFYQYNHQTIYDIITFRPADIQKQDYSSDSYLLQSHRFVVFLGMDDQRYVLDSTRTQKIEPILLDIYLSTYLYPEEQFKVIASYKPDAKWITVSRPLEVYSAMELLAYQQQGIIVTKKDTLSATDSLLFRQSLQYRDVSDTFSAHLPQGLEVKSASGKMFNMSEFSFSDARTTKKTIEVESSKIPHLQGTLPATLIVDGKRRTMHMAVSPAQALASKQSTAKKTTTPIQQSDIKQPVSVVEQQFQFGIPGEHLKFSQPIQIVQKVDLVDGSMVSLGVKHGNDTVFGTGGLSTDANTLCNDGEASLPGSQAIVQNGTVTFWTCGASTFSLTYTGGASAGYFMDSGFTDFTLSFLTGVQFPTGTTINDVNVAINWMPIDNESPTGPWTATACFPGEKSFQLYHPDGTVVGLVNAGQLTIPNSSCPQVLTTFDDQATGATITTTYATGTYKPTAGQTLSSFNNKSPFGGWRLRMSDNTLGDGVILFGFTISITTNPDITTNSGNALITYYPEASNTGILDINTFDPTYTEGSGLVYSLSGSDAAKFAINASGMVTWITPPLYDLPTDSGANNVYDLRVIVTNLVGNNDAIDLSINVIRAIGQSCKSQVDLSTSNTCMTTTSGTVMCRGANTNRQIADGIATTTNRSLPVAAPLFGSSIMQVDAAQNASFVVTTTGQVRSVGFNNTYGQLGDGTTTNRTTPINGLAGVLRVYNTQFSTCALLRNSTVKCRGRNSNGQVGSTPVIPSNIRSPINVLSSTGVILTGVIDMALQGTTTCAIKSDGSVYCRGAGNVGSLGNGTSSSSPQPFPQKVIGVSNAIQIVGGGAGHACALQSDGLVKCRGASALGQIGDGGSTITNRLTGSLVSSLTGVVSLAASNRATCALRNNGQIKCRGANTSSALGNGGTTNSPIPVNVTGTNYFVQLFSSSSAGRHFCAATATGAIYCRGLNANGQLGDSTTANRNIPTLVTGGVSVNVNALCPINSKPIIQNNSGNALVLSYLENNAVSVIDTLATDDIDSEGNGITYTLTGSDSSLFSINTAGIVSWLSTPDFENPLDNGNDNVYNVTIVSTDTAGLTDTIDLSLTVIDVYEGPITPGCTNRDPRAWYKADDGAYNGTIWRDHSVNARDVDSNSTRFDDPRNSLVNFNPSYHFDGSNYWFIKKQDFIHDANWGSMWYTVANYDKVIDTFGYAINFTVAGGSTENAALLADNDKGRYHGYDIDPSGNRIDAFANDPLKPQWRVLTAQRFKDDVAISEDGKEIDRQTNSIGDKTFNMLSIGMQHDNAGNRVFPWFGNIPEVILYNDTHSDIDSYNRVGTEDERIESYLAIKYGQTLHHDYLDGYSNIIYDTTTYSNNIFGVGRQDCESLYQKQSRSENPNALISLSTDSTLAIDNASNPSTITNDASYLVLGDNGVYISSWTTIGAPTGHAILPRVRKSQNTNFVDKVSIFAPAHTSSLGVKLPAPSTGVVKLAVDPDGNFADGNAVVYPMTLIGTEWSVIGVALTSTDYISFVIESPTLSGLLCIEAPNILSTGFVAKRTTQTIDIKSDYFKVRDDRGSDSGYYTTISLSALTNAYGGAILPNTVLWKADPMVVLSGSYNPLVGLGLSIGSYMSASSPTTYIYRNIGINSGLTGTYGAKLNMRFSIPAYKSIGSYSGTITYTLYEN